MMGVSKDFRRVNTLPPVGDVDNFLLAARRLVTGS